MQLERVHDAHKLRYGGEEGKRGWGLSSNSSPRKRKKVKVPPKPQSHRATHFRRHRSKFPIAQCGSEFGGECHCTEFRCPSADFSMPVCRHGGQVQMDVCDRDRRGTHQIDRMTSRNARIALLGRMGTSMLPARSQRLLCPMSGLSGCTSNRRRRGVAEVSATVRVLML